MTAQHLPQRDVLEAQRHAKHHALNAKTVNTFMQVIFKRLIENVFMKKKSMHGFQNALTHITYISLPNFYELLKYCRLPHLEP